MDRASSEPEQNTEPRKRTVGDTSFEDAESSSNKRERLMSPPFVSLVADSSLWKETPSWALILHNEISDLKASMAKLLSMKEEIKSEIKVDLAEFKDELSGKVAEIEKSAQFVSNKYDEANLAASTALETSKKVKEEYLEIRAQIEELRLVADEAAQYSRRNCLIISGIPEMKKEDTDKIVIDITEKWLDIQLDIGKIDRTHRLKVKGSQGMPRPIIVKFCNYHDRESMYRAKRKLKGTKITITEHLTRRRYNLFKLAKEAFGVRNVWTLDGKIFTNKGVDAEGRRYLIQSESDIYKV